MAPKVAFRRRAENRLTELALYIASQASVAIAHTLGFARRAFAEALGRATGRVAFRKPIAEHQLIQAKLADMAIKIDAAALLVYRAAWQSDATDDNVAREPAMAKLYASEIAFEVIDEALQIFGGLGVVRGTVVERLLRQARAFPHFRRYQRNPAPDHRAGFAALTLTAQRNTGEGLHSHLALALNGQGR